MCLTVKQLIWKHRLHKDSCHANVAFSCTFIYISSYLKVTKFAFFLSLRSVNILSSCFVMSAVWRHAGSFSLSLLSPFVFLTSFTCFSSTPNLKSVFFPFCLLDLLYVWCSAQVSACSCFSPVISRHCFERYLSILHAILVSQPCGVRVIALPSSVFIFALSSGLSLRCCPRVIVCHNQGGDLSPLDSIFKWPWMS